MPCSLPPRSPCSVSSVECSKVSSAGLVVLRSWSITLSALSVKAATRKRERGLPEIAEWADDLHASMSAARAAGETFYKQSFGKELLAEAKPTTPRALPPVYVIVVGGCVSACLDAVDTFTRCGTWRRTGKPRSRASGSD